MALYTNMLLRQRNLKHGVSWFFFRKDEPYEEALGALVNLLRYPPVIRHILCYLCQPFMVSYKAFSRMVK